MGKISIFLVTYFSNIKKLTKIEQTKFLMLKNIDKKRIKLISKIDKKRDTKKEVRCRLRLGPMQPKQVKLAYCIKLALCHAVAYVMYISVFVFWGNIVVGILIFL